MAIKTAQDLIEDYIAASVKLRDALANNLDHLDYTSVRRASLAIQRHCATMPEAHKVRIAAAMRQFTETMASDPHQFVNRHEQYIFDFRWQMVEMLALHRRNQ